MKNFFTKLKNWLITHRPTKRRIIQLYVALLYNANIKGFFTGRISTAGSKNVCVPGFNCYSCPGAVGACPLGSVQNALGSSKTNTIAYVFGIIVLFGLILGRTICGFLCPMGLLQDLIYKIKSKKVKKSRVTRILSYFKYVVLIVFIILVPLAYSKTVTLPAFCQFICPVGTLSGFALLSNPSNAGELASLAVLFTWKFCVLVLIIIGSIFVYRLFCRFLCPLGALYSLFSRLALLGIKLDKKSCIDCGLCIKTCKVDIKRVGDHECIQCGQCVAVCPTKAISWKGSQVFLLDNQIEKPLENEKVDLEAINYANADVRGFEEASATVSEQKTKKPPLYCLRKNNGKGFKIIASVIMAIVLVASLVYFNFIHKEIEASNTYAVGDVIKDFTSYEFFSEDNEYAFIEDSEKITVLNFWYIGCGGCETEMPHFGALASDEEYNDKVSVVVVHSNDSVFGATDSDELLDGTKVDYLEKYVIEDKNWNFYQDVTWIMDLNGEDSLYLKLGGTGAWPMTAIVDADGVIRFITASSVTEEILYNEIDKILNE